MNNILLEHYSKLFKFFLRLSQLHYLDPSGYKNAKLFNQAEMKLEILVD